MIFSAYFIVIRKCSVEYRSNQRYNKSLCMQLCLYDPNTISKGHFVPRFRTTSYLDFSLSKKLGLISFICHISLLVLFFFGKLLWWLLWYLKVIYYWNNIMLYRMDREKYYSNRIWFEMPYLLEYWLYRSEIWNTYCIWSFDHV